MSAQPLILDIKGNSLDDGPGIRSVVFFKGCPLNCRWCQNPESKSPKAELLWDAGKCTRCGTCIDLCHPAAIADSNTAFIDREKCTLCFACVDECPTGALARAGRPMSVDEIVRQVVRYRDFFESSGGGVTLSGGEPTLWMEFIGELLRALKKEGIHTLLETCGQFSLDRFSALVLPWLDEIYFDIKLIDPLEHERHCGISNRVIIDNFVALNTLASGGRITLLPRTPLIPGITDGEERIRALGEFYREQRVTRIGLLANNPIWLDKLKKLGRDDPFGGAYKIRGFYDGEEKKRILERFREYGITAVFG